MTPPPPPPTLRSGKLCYLEIPARDVHQSAAFYQRVFAWNIRFRDTDRPSFDDTTGRSVELGSSIGPRIRIRASCLTSWLPMLVLPPRQSSLPVVTSCFRRASMGQRSWPRSLIRRETS